MNELFKYMSRIAYAEDNFFLSFLTTANNVNEICTSEILVRTGLNEHFDRIV